MCKTVIRLPIKTNQPGGPQGGGHSLEQMGKIMFNQELEDKVVQHKPRERISFWVNLCNISRTRRQIRTIPEP